MAKRKSKKDKSAQSGHALRQNGLRAFQKKIMMQRLLYGSELTNSKQRHKRPLPWQKQDFVAPS